MGSTLASWGGGGGGGGKEWKTRRRGKIKGKKDRERARPCVELSPSLFSNTVYQRIKVGVHPILSEILRVLRKG